MSAMIVHEGMKQGTRMANRDVSNVGRPWAGSGVNAGADDALRELVEHEACPVEHAPARVSTACEGRGGRGRRQGREVVGQGRGRNSRDGVRRDDELRVTIDEPLEATT
jgi:hypothetical protein